MSKHRWRESLQSLCENHTDPEEDEQLKLSKIEIQNKVSKASKLVNDRRHNRKNKNGEGNSRRESELSQLIEDFSRQYQLIYDLHVNLRRQLAQTYHDITEEGFYTASSDSASEASEDNYHPNGSLELVSRNKEVEDLKKKLTFVAQEKESLNSKHMESLSKIEELEKIVGLLENESKQLKNKLGDREGELSELAGALEARNKEALVLMKDLEAQVEGLNHEKGRLIKQVEYETMVVKKMQMKESNLEALVLSLKKAMQDKEDELSVLRPTVNGLESELNGLEGKLKELEEQFKRKDQENSFFKDEVDSLQGKVNRLENIVIEYEKGADNDKCAQIEINQLNTDKELLQGRISELGKQLEERGDQPDMSIQMEALTREVNRLQQEVDVKHNDEIKKLHNDEIKKLHEEKEALEGKLLELEITLTQTGDEMNSLQQQMTSERDKSQEKLAFAENQNTELTSKLTDRQMILNQQEDTINRLREDCKHAKSRLVQAAERKIEEMAVQFKKSLEANIMILRQRIRVAEQVQTENKESFKSIKERCGQEHLGLGRRVQEYSQMIATSKGEITNFFDATNDMLDGLQSLFDRLDDREGDFSSRISRVLDEITFIKNWVKITAKETKPVKDEYVITSDVVDIGSNDKAKINKEEEEDKVREMYELQNKVAELEKGAVEKEEAVMKLGEEKKEAIRQLCMSVEYHQNRCDQLIELLRRRC